jgi:two-component system, OmpR family, response regulator
MKQVDKEVSLYVPKVFVVCERTDTAPIWGFILRQQGLTVTFETSPEKAAGRWSAEKADLGVLDMEIHKGKCIKFCSQLRSISPVPILLLLPVYDENIILEAYSAGIDEVVVKPISPAIFLAKIMAWGRRSWTLQADHLSVMSAGEYCLEPARRILIKPDGCEVPLTNLEFQLLHVLMSRPGHVFGAEAIVQAIWGGYGHGDQVLLKNVVYRLRRKIEADPSRPVLLKTWQGGYSFQ